MKRKLAIAAGVLAALVGLAALALSIWRGPSPEQILASIEVPPSPVRSPEEALAAFRTAPGFRVELVASEPLVVDPVAMDWDDRGRLYVVEMRGYMPNIDGDGEDRPTGRVVRLEDRDGDGRMDESEVFLDGLVMPRAIAVLPEGVLIGAPPDLWLCRDTSGDGRCDDKRRVLDYAAEEGNVEHLENGLLPALDGWLYNAKSARRFRFEDGVLVAGETAFRGQWGIAQDNEGRLFHNHNSGFVYADEIPAEYTLRQPAVAADPAKLGVSRGLTDGASVYGVRVAAGLNRAYIAGTLRRDGRQAGPTGVSSLVLQRGDQFGDAYAGDAFVPESAGSAVAHFAIERDGNRFRAEHRLVSDPDYGEREFLASPDERFRPVDVKVGPDGALWVIDMYRGVIQHATYVSAYLRSYVEEHGLAEPGATGRIWRVVREDRPIAYAPPPLDTVERQLAALDHPNGWVRDRAQRRLAFEAKPEAIARLRRLSDFGPLGRRHAIWTLAASGSLDAPTWRLALRDRDAANRRAALRAGESLSSHAGLEAIAAITPLLEDADDGVRVQAIHSLGSLPLATRPLAMLLAAGRAGDPLTAQAAVSGLGGLEFSALRAEIARSEGANSAASQSEWIERLGAAAHRAAQAGPEPAVAVASLLDIAQRTQPPLREEILRGIVRAQQSPGAQRVELATAHAIFSGVEEADADGALAQVRRYVTWPGDPNPGGARPLTPEEEALRERGAALYAASCAACHRADGRGAPGLAPPLAGSPWVLDADEWLVRIALGGLTGPIRVHGQDWNLTMPGHGHDARFDDDTLAGLLTHLRRSWGHGGEPVAPETVARIRAQSGDRAKPWTADELLAMPIDHRLDRFTGSYEVPIVGIRFQIRRDVSVLTIGIGDTTGAPLDEVDHGLFIGQGLTIRFQEDESGSVDGARVTRDGTTFPVSKES